nr:hypothetical protein [Treponema sp.]
YLTEIYVQGQGAAGTGEFAEGNTSGSASSGGTGSTGSGTSLAADGSMAHPFTTFNDALEFIKAQKDRIAVNGESLSSADYVIWIDGYLNTSVEIGHNFTEAGSLTIRGAGFSGADERGITFDGIGGPFKDDTENPLISLDAVCFKVTSEVPIIIENLAIRNGYSGILAGRYYDGETVDVPVDITLSDGVYVINNNSIETMTGEEAEKLSNLELTSLGGGITLCHGNLTLGINEENAFAHIWENSAETGAGLLLLGGSVQISYTDFYKNSAEINGGGLALLGGTVEMLDGGINSNRAKEKGAGLYMTGGTFTQKGGSIEDNEMSEECNSQAYGAGVYVGYYEDPETSTSSAATFNMEGGKIKENKSLNSDISLCGAGVYVDAKVDGDEKLAGSFNMTGGQIVNNIGTNNDDSNGAAIYLASGANLSIIGQNNPVTAVNEYAAENEGDSEFFYSLDEVLDGRQWPVIYSNRTTDSESAQNRGGAIFIKGETPDFPNNINIKNALILKNSAPYGGAIAAQSSEGSINITMEDTIIYDNRAMSWNDEGKIGGGAIFLETESGSQIIFTMESGMISKNEGAGYGGAICLYDSKFVMNNGIIGGDSDSLGNYTTDKLYGSGGAVFVGYQSEFEMNGGSIKYNSAGISTAMGGGAVNAYSGKFTMNGGEISNNTSYYHGGGVYIGSSGEFCMKGGLIAGNTASEKGDGVYQNKTSTNTGVFKMGGSAKIASGNDVYILGVVTVIGKLTAESPVATLRPEMWNTVSAIGEADATQLILLDENIDTVSEAEGLETTGLAEASQAFAVQQPEDESRSYFVTESGKLDWK